MIEIRGQYYLEFETSKAIRRAFGGKLAAYHALRLEWMPYPTYRKIMLHHAGTQGQVSAIEQAYANVPSP